MVRRTRPSRLGGRSLRDYAGSRSFFLQARAGVENPFPIHRRLEEVVEQESQLRSPTAVSDRGYNSSLAARVLRSHPLIERKLWRKMELRL
jgi:hypothetical protein